MRIQTRSPEESIIALGPWLETPVGRYVAGWEQSRLDELTADIFGFNALQIGLPQIEALNASRMPHLWVSNTLGTEGLQGSGEPTPEWSKISLRHDVAELPFASQSLDLVILPHVLEFAVEPHQVLREVERVLIPEGQLIVCGFNPASLWGIRQAAGRLTGAHFLPLDGNFISLPRLKDWLKLLNMEVDRGHFGCYAPPCRTMKWLDRYNFMELAGNRWWPYFGAVYMVQAIKRVKGMRLIGPPWKRQLTPKAHAVPAANRGVHRTVSHRTQQN
jgi:SAM-dependent methyltransferase